jgi:Abnormal spindle-like microcephaly-assoc'd, ASPM-SPD-2-Hydin
VSTFPFQTAVYSRFHLSINNLHKTIQSRSSRAILVMMLFCFPIAAFCRSGPQLSAITCRSSSFSAPGTDSCSVYLTGSTSSRLIVSLSSDNGAVTVPSAVTVSARASKMDFNASVSAVTTSQIATITARSGTINRTFRIQLNPAATPILTVNTTSISFGSAVVNTAVAKSVTLTSAGTGPVTISAATVTGTGFTMSGTSFPLTLNPGQTAILTVQFYPTIAGAASGQFAIMSNSSVNPTVVIGLSGTGTAAAGTLSALSCSSGSMTGAGTDACMIVLNAAAGSGGLNVSLSSSNPAVTVPATVVVAANATSVGFPATVSSVSTAQSVTLTATANGISKTFALQLNASTPSLGISATSISFGNVYVGQSPTLPVVLTSTGTAPVTISGISIAGSLFTAPGVTPPITLAPGQAVTLNIQFFADHVSSFTGILTISSNSPTKPTSVVNLSGSGIAALSALSCTPGSITGAGTVACTVTLNGIASSTGLQVNLSSSNGAVTVPATVNVPTYATGAGFTANVSSSGSSQAVTLTASAGAVSKFFTLQLNAATSTLSSLTCNSASMSGVGSDACTVTLSSPAPIGGMSVSLSSSNSAATVPASVMVPANAISAGFTANVSSVTSVQSVTLTATASGASTNFVLQLTPATPTLSINATSVSFGSVVLNTPTTQSVILTSSGTSAVIVNATSVTGTGFSVSGSTFPVTLNPGQAVTLSVQFDPIAIGSATGLLTIKSNSSVTPTATISLSGSGMPHEVDLNWNPPSGYTDPIVGYNVYRAPSGSSSYQLIGPSDAQTTYADTTVQSGQSYDYIVKTVGSTGMESAPSNVSSVAVP